MPRPRLVYVTTLAVTPALLLRGQLAHMRSRGFDVHVVCSPGEELEVVATREGVSVHPLPIPREVDPGADLVALVRLVRLFRELQPDIVNASTPKGGLLGMLAARICQVPVRIYLLRGLRLETTDGVLLRALETTEKLASGAAHRVVSVSHSLRSQYVPRFAPPEKCIVLGSGSSNGVSLQRFEPSPERSSATTQLRARLDLPEGPFTIGFAGRLVADKGIEPLLDAFEVVRAQVDARLLLVGDDLAGDRVEPRIRARVEQDRAIHVLPRMNELGPFYGLLDVLAFPSLREGFPNVPLEASMAGIPVAGFASTGVVDAVEDGVTGRLVPTGDTQGLAGILVAYARDPDLARAHGEAGHRRARERFAPHTVWAAWEDLYTSALREAGLPLPAPPLVLHVLPSDLAGEPGQDVRRLRARLDGAVRHELVTLFQGVGELEPEHALGVPSRNVRRWGYNPRASLRLGALLERVNPDILVTHGEVALHHTLPVRGERAVLHRRTGTSSISSPLGLEVVGRALRGVDLVCGTDPVELEEAVRRFGVPPDRCLLLAGSSSPTSWVQALTTLGLEAPRVP